MGRIFGLSCLRYGVRRGSWEGGMKRFMMRILGEGCETANIIWLVWEY